MQDSIFSKAKVSVSTIKEKVSELKDEIWSEEQKLIIQEFKESGTEKVKKTLENIGGSSAIFVRSGYELKSVSINLGLPPVITSSFHFLKDISAEERTQILEETKESRIVHLLITCLLRASDYFEQVRVGDYKMSNVNITIGLTPGISITFNKE